MTGQQDDHSPPDPAQGSHGGQERLAQASLLADARTREKALSTSLENALQHLREVTIKFERAESERQRYSDDYNEVSALSALLTQRLEELEAAERRLTLELEHQAQLAAKLEDENSRVREAAERAEQGKDLLSGQISWLQQRLDQSADSAKQDKDLLGKHIEWLQGQVVEGATKAAETDQAFQAIKHELEAMLQLQAASLHEAQRRILVALGERTAWPERLRRLIGRPPSSPAFHQLADWRPKIAFDQHAGAALLPAAHNQGLPMLLPTNPGSRNPYHRANSLAELLLWNDVDFVRCAYVTILGRQPDANGEAHFTNRLRNGDSKYGVIWQLRRSAEARKHDPGIAGLDRALKREALRRNRLFGWLIRVFLPGENLSKQDRRTRQLLNMASILAEQQSRQADGLEKITARLDRLHSFAIHQGERTAEESGDAGHISRSNVSEPLIARDDLDLSSRERALLSVIKTAVS